MPIYEYQCTACGHHLEALQKFSDAPLTTCPKCQQTALNKLVSAAGFQLKGSGWYATDYKAKAKPQAKEENSGSSKDSQTTESKADTKSNDVKTKDSKAE